MMMKTMRAKMKMNNTRESKAIDMKNKNEEIYKGNRESTISQAKIKETIATEIEIKSGKEKENNRFNPKDTKHKVTQRPRQPKIIMKQNKSQRKEGCKVEKN